MTFRALIAACLIWVAMSPAAMEAFSKIAGADIKTGIMDLQDDEVYIYAIGNRNGQSWGITCRWICGRPEWIVFSNPNSEL